MLSGVNGMLTPAEKPSVLKDRLRIKGFPEVELAWGDNFDEGFSKWVQDTLENDGLHRAAYEGLGIYGQQETHDWNVVPARWAAQYIRHREKVQYIEKHEGKNVLHMGGYIEKENNPYRRNFVDPQGRNNDYGDYIISGSWLSTLKFKQDENGKHVRDPENTTLILKPGCYLEALVNFELMKTRGMRWSLWLMAAIHGNINYDSSISNGAEVDFEIENPSRTNEDFGHEAHVTIIGGEAGNTIKQSVDLRKFGINIRKGWHKIGFFWHEDGHMSFMVDHIEVNTDPRKMDDAEMYALMTREFNSGIKDASEGDKNAYPANRPYFPPDPGLSGQSVILDKDLINDDKVMVQYVHYYRVVGSKPVEKTVPHDIIDLGSDDTERQLDSIPDDAVIEIKKDFIKDDISDEQENEANGEMQILSERIDVQDQRLALLEKKLRRINLKANLKRIMK